MNPPNLHTDKTQKNLSYYFRFNMKTIQGSLTTGFMSLAMLSAVLVAISNWYWSSIVENYKHSWQILQPSANLIYQIGGHVSDYTENLQLSVIHKNISYQLQAEQDWQQQVQPALDSLNKLSILWQNQEDFIHLEDLNKHTTLFRQESLNIIQAYKSINNAEGQTAVNMLILQQIVPVQLKIKRASSLLNKSLLHQQTILEDQSVSQRSFLPFVMLSFFVVAFILAFAFGTYIVSTVLSRIRNIKNVIRTLSQGNIPEPVSNTQDEMNSIINSINILSANLTQITHFASEVGKGIFTSDVKVFDNQGVLGQSLAAMRDSLKNVSQNEQLRSSFSENYTAFVELLRHHNQNLQDLANVAVSRLCKIVSAVQGSLYFIEQNNQNEAVLVLKSCYAFDKHRTKQQIIRKGQGLAGQVWLEKQTTLLTQVPNNYVSISSGLGGQNPQNIIVVPLISDMQVHGVLELAFFKQISQWDKNFIERACESLAATVKATETAEQTQKLLAESVQLSNQLRLQEESIRQQMEELQATQENASRAGRDTQPF